MKLICSFFFPQTVNDRKNMVFKELLRSYEVGKAQYLAVKEELR